MLYNEELKKEFLNTYTQSDVAFRKTELIFQKIGDIESEYNTDLCYVVDKDMLLKMIRVVSANRSTGTNIKLSILRRYVNWCSERLDGVSAELINSISAEDINIDYIKLHMASDSGDFKYYLSTFLRSDDDLTMDIVFKCIMWMGYSGIPEEKITDIKTEDVQLEVINNRFVILNEGLLYSVPAEAFDTFKKCVELTGFNYEYSKATKMVPRADGNKLLRGIKAVSSQTYLIQQLSVKRKQKNLERNINYTSATWSGFFYRLHELEKKNKIDFLEEAGKYIGDRIYKLDKTRMSQENIRTKISKEIKFDYELWKKAFGK